ncbi:MAG: Tad domain-containing protein [Chloroflexota bacterium]
MLSFKRHVTNSPQGGQALAIFALFLTFVLLLSAALVIDYGSWLKVRRDYQNAVDAAVLQGSVLLSRPVTVAKQVAARQAVWTSLAASLSVTLPVTDPNPGPNFGQPLWNANTAIGAPITAGGYRMWVSTPPLGAQAAYAGAYSGSNRVAYAWVERNSEAFLGRIYGLGNPTISSWASAGSFPNRFAVITLRKNGQPTNGNPTDLDVNGGTILNVIDGDLGGNWGLSVNGVTSGIRFTGSTPDTYGVFLTEYVPAGGNGWTPSQIVDAANNPVTPQYLAEVADPAYPAPCLTYGVGVGSGCLENRDIGAFPPDASTNRTGDSCPIVGNVDRLPAGRYDDITVPNGRCLVLDPTYSLVSGKTNGIFYITGTLDINNSGLVIGDGVTLVFARGGDLDMNAGATISLNSGNATLNPLATACGGTALGGDTTCKYGAWAVKSGAAGVTTWAAGTTVAYTPPSDPFMKGMAVYVCKSAASCGSGGGPSTNILQMTSGSGIDYRGLIYAPFDNVKMAGQPTHNNIGQLVAWTAQFTGGSQIFQTYDGPDSTTPVLLEPRLGQ